MRFYLSNQNNPVNKQHDLWNKLLPSSRQGYPQDNDGESRRALTYGQYFSAVEAFIESCPDLFVRVSSPSHDNISVFLEKHGAFYHPCRIAVDRERHVDEYVLNVAFSEPGRQYLKNEYNTLKMIEKKYAYVFITKVFAHRDISVTSAKTASIFAGEWFGSYHEFHVSEPPKEVDKTVRVWDPVDADCFLTKNQARHLYEQAAMILTACYDIQTFEHVASWHHAAGDFVVNLEKPDTPQVKLVTVRRYIPILNSEEKGGEAVLNSLLLFLLDLSIRMRLDRRDGINEICWMEDFVVGATIRGFFRGLALQSQNQRIPDTFIAHYNSLLADTKKEDFLELFRAMANRFPESSPDTPTIQLQIDDHAHIFHQTLQPHL